MQSWFFTEDAYPYLPDATCMSPSGLTSPTNTMTRTKVQTCITCISTCGARRMSLDWRSWSIEHHQTATCVVPAAPIMLGILARQTRRARLLILGNPIANRSQPLRVAEEMAMIDVISRGRLECGFVRSVPYEAAPANVLPLRGMERLWKRTI